MAIAVAIVGVSVLGLVWMGIRSDYRKEYVEVDQFSNSRSHARAAGQRPHLGVLQERLGRACGGPPTRWSTGCGPSTILRWRVAAGAERPAAHQRRDPERRADAHRHAAGILSGQARAHVGQREGPEILQRARRRARIEHEHRVRLCRRGVHRFRHSADVRAGLRVSASSSAPCTRCSARSSGTASCSSPSARWRSGCRPTCSSARGRRCSASRWDSWSISALPTVLLDRFLLLRSASRQTVKGDELLFDAAAQTGPER